MTFTSKKALIVCCMFFSFTLKAQQNHALNMTLLAHWNDTTLSHCDQDQIWNNLTGWHDTIKNREYLIAGSCDSLYFFDITDPIKMIKCDVRDGAAHAAVNRDYDTYKHYLYCVSDRDNGYGSLQIFDLQYLPDSVHKVYDDNTYCITSHTLFIETKSQRLYLCANTYKPAGFYPMAILSIANPELPVLIGTLPSDYCSYTHEVYVRNDTAYCSCGNQGLFMYDVRNATKPVLLGSITNYPKEGYNHSSWLDSSGKYLMFTDEVPTGLPIKIYDISDIQNAKQVSLFNSNIGATPHNAKWKGRYAWVSSYEDGVFVYDLLNPYQPKVAAYFDTYMKNPIGVYSTYYHGCWGVYPFLPSGNIIASDISEGLFVIKPETITFGVDNIPKENIYASISPNPVKDKLALNIFSPQRTEATLRIMNMLGEVIIQKKLSMINGDNEFIFNDFNSYIQGIYTIQVRTNEASWSSKFLKQ